MDKRRILIVDDEKDLVRVVTARLEFAGYEVIAAYDGLEGLEKARSEKPDLIVLDVMLPKLDGYRICALLKNDNRYMKIPVIMFTARAGAKDMETGKEVGADAYMTKPFEPQTLLERIKELVG